MAVVAAMLGAHPASAQSAGAAGNLIGDIVVTAQKRTESILAIPISVTAVSEQQIDRAGLKDLEQLGRTVPGLSVVQAGEQEDKRFVIRGIGTTSGAATVAVYVDDTPITAGLGAPDLKLFDVTRIEVLRGPQGTLFGTSSLGGAVRFVTPEPGFGGFSGRALGEISRTRGGGTSTELRGALGGPLVADQVAFRVSAFRRHDAGYIDLYNEFTGKLIDDDINSSNSYGGRGAVAAKLGAGVKVTASANFQDTSDRFGTAFFTGRGVETTIALPDFARVDRAPVGKADQFFLPNLTINADLGFADLTSSSSYVSRNRSNDNDFSYFVQAALGLPDVPGADLVVPNRQTSRFRAFVQEVRLASKPGSSLEWLVGGFYERTRDPQTQRVSSNLATVVPPFADAVLPGGVLFSSDETDRTRQLAVFGEAKYTLLDKLTLTAGLRYTDLSLDIVRSADGLFNGGPTADNTSSSGNQVTPKFSVGYALGNGGLVYATVAKGFRAGGPNSTVPSAIPACATALASLGINKAPSSYDPDSVWSYEVGGKAQTANHRLRVAAAAYRIDWSKIQQTITLAGGCGFSFVGNVGEARSTGFEAEVTWTPVDALTIAANVGHANARLSRDLVTGADASGPIVAAPKGTRLADVPLWTADISTEVRQNLGGGFDGFFRTELQYVGKSKRSLNTPSDDPRVVNRDDYKLFNLRAGVRYKQYELELFANNLFDENVILYESFSSFAPGTASERARLRPRQIGVSLGVDF